MLRINERDRQFGRMDREMHITCCSSVLLGRFAGEDNGVLLDDRLFQIEIGTL
jgi:hypothetical protein